jgi:RNA polymerase sigma factor (TIGR02999 family)
VSGPDRDRGVTQLLADWHGGDQEAFGELLPMVYEELRRLARRHLGRERAGHTLSTTALVHEAYFRLAGQEKASFRDRAHFLSVAAMAMRRILVNHARDRVAQKRGGKERPVTLEEGAVGHGGRAAEVLVIDELLDRLAALDERQARVVLYRFYGGLDDAEIADLLSVSVPTVRRDWRAARAFLARELARAREGA